MVQQSRRTPTIRDVAKKAGVSISAVSFALNQTGTLAPETRERVRSVADAMNYRANALARGLRRAPIGVIGFVTRPLDTIGRYQPLGVDVFARAASTASNVALDHGLGMALLPDLMRSPLPPLALSLDGYVVMNPERNDPVLRMLTENHIPYVTVGTNPSVRSSANWVGYDETAATAELLDELWRAGARQIAYVGGQARDSFNLNSERAYLHWVRQRGCTPVIRHVSEGLGEEGGRRVGARLLKTHQPDGIFALTGRHATGIQAAAREQPGALGRRTLIVAGSDSEQTRSAQPAITSVAIPAEQLGAESVTMLAAILQGEHPTNGRFVQYDFRRRASTGW